MSRFIPRDCKTDCSKKCAVICHQREAQDSLPPRRNKKKFHHWCCTVLEIDSISVLSPPFLLLQLLLLSQSGLHHKKLDAGRVVSHQVRRIRHPSDLSSRNQITWQPYAELF
ncbi:hypothetical protein L798_06713 [Zootermopsis nevadensis]|uniref:Uncharacterized protein n=1 Tax=Zootermopsis nevadensis TaxID=136037 RepID=A0A067RKA7_ZOONE|nr:hypothetical protein L798_06713 [Zootermopsis nevadensis]